MTAKKPEPLIRRITHERCPVCHEISYSRAGMHPQCAVRQADAARISRLQQSRLEAKNTLKAAASTSDIKPWQKLCPKCRTVQHIRKRQCDCGHVLAARPPQSSHETSQDPELRLT